MVVLMRLMFEPDVLPCVIGENAIVAKNARIVTYQIHFIFILQGNNHIKSQSTHEEVSRKGNMTMKFSRKI